MIHNSIYILKAPREFAVETKKLENPNPGYVTLQYLYCGICGGDYSCYLGRRTDYPATLGHEFVGRIIAQGTGSRFSLGDTVVSDFNYRCGSCSFCREGKSHLCIHNAEGYFSNRGFAQYGNVREDYLYLIPEMGWLPRACVIEPLSCVIHACQMLSIKPDDRILLVGGGSIGSMFAFYFTSCLHCRYVEIFEKIGLRSQNLKDCFGINIPVGKNAAYDLVIDCSNDPSGTLLALHNTRPGGRICVMSHLYGLDTSFIYEEICKKELRPCFPLRNGEYKNLQQAISCITEWWNPFYDRLIHVYNDINTAFAEKEHSPWNKQVVRMFRGDATGTGMRNID